MSQFSKTILNKYLKYFLVFLSFLALAIIFTYPLITNFTNSVSGWESMNDSQLFLWNFWWVKKAIVDLGTNPFYTNYIYYPQNVSLTLHTLTFFPALVSVAFQFFTKNIIIVYNTLFLLTFAFSGLGTYLLIKFLFKNQAIAWIAGAAFAFCPYIFAHAYAGHFNLINTWAIPFYLYFLLRMFEGQKIHDVFLATMVLLLQTYTDFHYLLFLIIISIIVGIYHLIKDRKTILPHLKNSGILVVIWILLSLPILIPSYNYSKTNNQYQSTRVNYKPAADHTDLKHFWPGPNYLNGFMTSPELKDKVEKEYPGGIRENLVFLGYTTMFLALSALFVNRDKKRWLWLAIAVGFFVISLGGGLYYNQKQVLSAKLPAAYLSQYVFSNSDIVWSRFAIISQLMLVILAAGFLSWLFSDVKLVKNSKPLRLTISAAAAILIALEFYNVPIALTKYQSSPLLSTLAKDQTKYHVITLPDQMYYQTIFEKPQLAGALGRRAHDYYMDNGAYHNIPGIRLFYAINNPSVKANHEDRDPKIIQEQFQKLNIGYIMVNKDRTPSDEVKKYRQICEEILQLKVNYEDEILIAYRTQ